MQNVKAIIKAAKQFKGSRNLPILECVKLRKDVIEFTDLGVSVQIPYTSGLDVCIAIDAFITMLETLDNPIFKCERTDDKFKVFATEGKQTIKVGGENPDNFPVMFERGLAFKAIGSLPANVLPLLLDALTFISKDDLRPAMTHVLVKDEIVATNAHLLYHKPIVGPFAEGVLLSRSVIKLMEVFGGDWDVLYHNGESCIVELYNGDGVRIIYKGMDAVYYPNYRMVIPEVTADTPTATINNKSLRAAIKTGAKFAGKGSNQCVVELNGKATYSTQDADFDREYATEFDAEYKEEIRIGFDFKYLDSILDQLGDTVTLNYWTPNKAVILDEHYLLMPIMVR
jgi:hypothetical protein